MLNREMLIRRKRTFILEVGKSKYAESKQNPNAGKKLQTESKKQAGSTQVRLLKNTTDATYKTKDRHACNEYMCNQEEDCHREITYRK